eukprot:3007286-Pleurochrysis_carterae.AAC.6
MQSGYRNTTKGFAKRLYFIPGGRNDKQVQETSKADRNEARTSLPIRKDGAIVPRHASVTNRLANRSEHLGLVREQYRRAHAQPSSCSGQLRGRSNGGKKQEQSGHGQRSTLVNHSRQAFGVWVSRSMASTGMMKATA